MMELHAKQKDGHDRWVLSDLRALGYSERAVRLAPVTPAVKAYVAWNRFTVQDGAPLAILGTACVLGLLSVRSTSDLVQALVRANTIPGIEKAVAFFSGRRDTDPRHIEQLEQAITQVMEPEDCEAIHDSARTTRAHYAGLFTSPVVVSLPGPQESPFPSVWGLTEREKEVILALVEGGENKDIANAVGCKVGTVRVHLRNIFRKVGVSNRAELVARYLRYLLGEEEPED